MEYNIFKIIRSKIKIPYFLRVFFWFLLIFLALFPLVLFPGLLFLGIFMLIVGILLIVPWKKIRHVVKIRKWIIYLFKNIHKKRIIRQKIKDIRDHIMDIIRERKKKRLKKKKKTKIN